MPDSIKFQFKKLSTKEKLVFAAGSLNIISVFLPWYSDIDRFNTGDLYLGITGPMYLAGLLLFLASSAVVGIIAFKLLDRKMPKLALDESQIYKIAAGFSLLMIIMTASVYFHPKFGVNPIDKNAGFGMMLAVVGCGMLFVGGLMKIKRREMDFDEDGYIKPLIDIERESQHLDVKKDLTIEEAMTIHNSVSDKTKAWGPVHESMHQYKSEDDNLRQ